MKVLIKNFTFNFLLAFLTFAFWLLSSFIQVYAANENSNSSFSDVPSSSFFFVPVSFLKEQNLVSGYSDGTFRPMQPVNRAEALTMIMKATGINVESPVDIEKTVNQENPVQINLPKSTTITLQNLTTGEKEIMSNIENLRITTETGSAKLKIYKKGLKKPFRDVSEKDWFFNTVREGKRLGIVKGVKNGKYFKPDNHVNLAEALRMIFQSSGTVTEIGQTPQESALPPGINAQEWYAKDIAYAISLTMLMQQENGSIFPPWKALNRGELATLLYRFLKSKDNIFFGYASWYGDGLAKTKLTTNAKYAEKNLTAAHKTLPFGTIVKVTNVENGKQVDVVINDRGPFVTGRIIDLSKTAFSALESPSLGIISVQLEILRDLNSQP